VIGRAGVDRVDSEQGPEGQSEDQPEACGRGGMSAAGASGTGVGEREWLRQSVALGVRGDGRGPLSVRPTLMETDVLVR
jgi:hypothetical protein